MLSKRWSFSPRFQFDERTKEIKELKHIENFDLSDGVHIDNITQKMEELYTDLAEIKSKTDNDLTVSTYLNKKKEYFAIIKYFERCWEIICSKGETKLANLYLVFVVPNEWVAESDIIEEFMVPLLSKSGVVFSHVDDNYRNRVDFASRLEASISYLQLNRTKHGPPKLPSFIENENRCILYDLQVDGTLVKFTALYFQIKEDYNLKLYDERYYTLKHISRKNILLFDSEEFSNIIHTLKLFVFKTVLKIDDSITKRKFHFGFATVEDYLLNEVFQLLNGEVSNV